MLRVFKIRFDWFARRSWIPGIPSLSLIFPAFPPTTADNSSAPFAISALMVSEICTISVYHFTQGACGGVGQKSSGRIWGSNVVSKCKMQLTRCVCVCMRVVCLYINEWKGHSFNRMCRKNDRGKWKKGNRTEEARQCNSKSCHQSFSIAIAMDWDFSPTRPFSLFFRAVNGNALLMAIPSRQSYARCIRLAVDYLHDFSFIFLLDTSFSHVFSIGVGKVNVICMDLTNWCCCGRCRTVMVCLSHQNPNWNCWPGNSECGYCLPRLHLNNFIAVEKRWIFDYLLRCFFFVYF